MWWYTGNTVAHKLNKSCHSQTRPPGWRQCYRCWYCWVLLPLSFSFLVLHSRSILGISSVCALCESANTGCDKVGGTLRAPMPIVIGIRSWRVNHFIFFANRVRVDGSHNLSAPQMTRTNRWGMNREPVPFGVGALRTWIECGNVIQNTFPLQNNKHNLHDYIMSNFLGSNAMSIRFHSDIATERDRHKVWCS